MNKKSNNNFVLMTGILIAVIVFLFSFAVEKMGLTKTTSDVIVKGFVLILAVALYIAFHLKETKEIKESKTTKESIAKTFFNYCISNICNLSNE